MSTLISSTNFATDPLKQYKEFREAIHSRAATLCTELDDRGCGYYEHVAIVVNLVYRAEAA